MISSNEMSGAINSTRITTVFKILIIINALVVNAMTYLGPRHSLSQFNALQTRVSKNCWSDSTQAELFQPGQMQMESIS